MAVVAATRTRWLWLAAHPTRGVALAFAVVLALIQVGGFGIMTLASLLALLVSGRLRMRTQLTPQAEGESGRGRHPPVVLGVARTTVAIELATAAVLAVRFHFGYGLGGVALYHGVFHGISAFNNAGFGLRDDNLVGYATDPWIIVPIAVAGVLGALGFPVLLELLRSRPAVRGRARHLRPLHTRLTLVTSAILLAVGTLLTCALEWSNPGTLGPMEWGTNCSTASSPRPVRAPRASTPSAPAPWNPPRCWASAY